MEKKRRGDTRKEDASAKCSGACTALPTQATSFMNECGPPDAPDVKHHDWNDLILDLLASASMKKKEIKKKLASSPETPLNKNVINVGGPAHQDDGPGGLADALHGDGKGPTPLPYDLKYTFEVHEGQQPRTDEHGKKVPPRAWSIVGGSNKPSHLKLGLIPRLGLTFRPLITS